MLWVVVICWLWIVLFLSCRGWLNGVVVLCRGWVILCWCESCWLRLVLIVCWCVV